MDPNDNNNNSNKLDINTGNNIVQLEETSEIDDRPQEGNYDTLPNIGTYEDFLHRPCRISESVWSVGTGVDLKIVPTRLLFNHLALQNKLKNCSRFRFDLVLRFHISSTPFHYGAVMFVWHPLVKNGDWINTYGFPLMTSSNGAGSLRSFSNIDLANRSLKRRVIIQAGDNAVKEMVIPFFWPEPYMDITNARTPALDNYGALSIVSLAPLGAVDPTAGGASIHIMAAFKNTDFAGPSHLTLQSGVVPPDNDIPNVEIREQNGGIAVVQFQSGYAPSAYVKVAANVMAHISSYLGLTSARPYCKAIHYVGRAMELLGFSNKISNVNTMSTDITNLKGIAAVESHTHCDTTSLVAKGVDAAAIPGALNIDEMDVEYMSNREMFLGNLTWDPANNAGTQLGEFYVTPHVCARNSYVGGGGNTVHVKQFMPLGYICTMFKRWRADINFRFVVHCSSLHRGKVMLRYDPAGPTTLAYAEEATTFSKVLDLAEAREFDFTVPFMAANSTLSCYRTGHCYDPGYNTGLWGSTLSSLNYLPEEMNGSFSLFVLSKLTTPSAAASQVRISIFVSAKNVHVNTPCNPTPSLGFSNVNNIKNVNIPNYSINGLELFQSGRVNEEYKDSENSGGLETRPIPDDVVKLYGCEDIKSLKALIQRKMPYNPIVSGVDYPSITGTAKLIMDTDFDFVPKTLTTPNNTRQGYQYTKIKGMSGTVYTTYNNIVDKYVPLAYLAPCFIGWKGGIRWTVSPRFDLTNVMQSKCILYTTDDYSTLRQNYFAPAAGTGADTANTMSSICLNQIGSSAGALTGVMSGRGYATSTVSSNSKLDIVHHDYVNMLFQPTRAFWDSWCVTNSIDAQSSNYTPVAAIDVSYGVENKGRFAAEMILPGTTSGERKAAFYPFDTYVGAHDDFRFVYFDGVPPLEYTTVNYNYDFTAGR